MLPSLEATKTRLQMIRSWLETVSWPHTWTDDPRTRIWPSSSERLGADCYMFSVFFWLEILAFIVLGIGISAVVGALLYVALKRYKTQGSSSTARWIIGYGVFCACWIVLPKPAADLLGLRNKIFRFCFCLLSPITSLFKTTAALHEVTPSHAMKSLPSFCLYYASPLTLLYDPKTQDPLRPSTSELLRSLLRFLGLLFVTGGFQSLFHLLSWFPSFGADSQGDDWYDVARLWNFSSWKDTFLYAVLFQLYLMTFGEGLLLLTEAVVGIKAQQIMDNPMLLSSSPSDFWGRRWNLIIHTCLKDGVYKPIRKSGGSSFVAVSGAFLASGLFHEWLIPVVFIDTDGNQRRPGYTLVFFYWNALLVCLEATLRNNKWITQTSQLVPKPARTLLVLLLAIPVGHMFCDPYVRSDFFLQGGVAFPMILRPR